MTHSTKHHAFQVRVFGGTYVDIELYIEGAIQADTSVEISSRRAYLGGPGYSFALLLSRMGAHVELVTRLGSGVWSDRARKSLSERHISLLEVQAEGDLDVATLVFDSTGRRMALNDYRLSKALYCSATSLSSPHPVLVASPTAIPSLVAGLRTLEARGELPQLYMAPHSLQVRQLADLSGSDRELIWRATKLLCVNESDFSGKLEAISPRELAVIVTRGAEGGWFGNFGERTAYPAVIVDGPVERSNGAGEAFFSGVLIALLRGGSLAAAAESGAVSAAHYLASPHENACEMIDPQTVESWSESHVRTE